MVRTPYIIQKLLPLITSFPSQKGKLFFTFDDGPHPEVTPLVLNLLAKYQAKATFFCSGSQVEKHPDLYQLILDEGHKTGNHTFSHLNGWSTKKNIYMPDVIKASQLIHSNLFRPPYGKISISQWWVLRKMYSIILWDVMSYDFDEAMSVEDCTQNVIKNAKDGSIIVFHDSLKAKEKILPTLNFLLDYYSRQAFSFASIE
jgi:peptidoglycan/xylan/chitin deacetylase (PgdA/CDA1 family)